ncbi:lantibiotic dehydratase [Streptomyces sp. NPDC049887]|uniref:lantibiotic dehydratase n=1 Tax=Streptomyces sp. NPDC049887 TaxID=3155654 RepID=UPI003423E623
MRLDPALFDVREPVLVRIASTPRSTAAATVDPDDPVTGIRRLAADPLLRQAVEAASGSLATFLRRLDDDEAPEPDRKRTLSAARTLTRYARRAGGRPTPFGLFAGVGVARFGVAAKTGFDGPGTVHARLDGGWLHRRVLEWLADPAVRRRVDVVLNDLCVPRDGRVSLRTGDRETSVRDSALVAAVREAAAAPVAYGDLLDDLAVRFPALDRDRLDTQLGGLVQHGFLLTSMTPHRIDGTLLDRIEAVLDAALPDTAQALRTVRARAAAHSADPPGAGRASWRSLLEAVRQLEPPGRKGDGHERPPVHVDLRMPADLVLPDAIGEEARRYATAVWAMTPEWATLEYMRDYRDRFIERYGTASAVPLGDLVDPHRGLGLPPEYQVPPAHSRSGPGEERDRPRRTALAELVQQALLDGTDLTLTEADVTRIATAAGHDPAVRPPRTLELCFQVLADSSADLDRGDFLLLGSAHIGSWTAGATAGRFAEAVGLTDGLARLAAAPTDEGTLRAQVELMPRDPRSLNIVQVPRLLPHRIPIGVADDRSDPHCLDWRTLLVAAGEDGLRLVHEPTGRQVVPVLPHMLALDTQAPPVARFLADLATARPRVWSGWDWGGLDILPCLPRVRYGRVVAAPRRWLAGRRLRDAARAGSATAWREGLAVWRDRLRVPDRLQIARNDQMFPIDLLDPWDQDLLRAELTAAEPRFVLYEDLTADGSGLGWNDGHSTEVVIPLVRAGVVPRPGPEEAAPARTGNTAPEPRQAPRATPIRRAPTDFHLPGEDWLFVKMYAEPAAHDMLLTDRLPALLADVEAETDRWFFLRYRDPDPHLRLRFHGSPDTLNTRVLPAVARHARAWIESGAVRSLTLDGYRPETDRYGGPAAQEAAERLFQTDSLSALLQLRARRAGSAALPDDLLAAVGHAVLLDALGEWDWCSWADHIFTKTPDHAVYQRHRATADRLIRPGGTTARVADALHLPALERLWTGTPEAAAYGRFLLDAPAADRDEAVLSLLHMRHNRLFGIDAAAEARGYAVLRGAARAHLGRRDHAAAGHDTTAATAPRRS